MIRKPTKYRNGYSESAWKSLIVKSLRIGWVEGLEEAASVMPPSEVKNLLYCGIFEDMFPASFDEMNEQIALINSQKYEELCMFETHHGRGLSDIFCDYETESVARMKIDGYPIFEKVIRPNTPITWLNPRVYNCLYTWYKIRPNDMCVIREPFHMPFKGMPKCILDGHTTERKGIVMLLSGHYDNHRAIGKSVMKNGWTEIREKFKRDPIVHPTEGTYSSKKPQTLSLF